MDENKCIICGCEENDVIYYFNELPKFKQIGDKRDIVKCKECDLIYCSPRNINESMLDIYENNYWQDYQLTVGELDIVDRVSDFEMISKERVGFIKEQKTNGKFLDVGCSQGFLVYEAKKSGFDAYGIDLNNFDIENGIKKYDVKLEKSFLSDYEENNFDVITSFNVIEHVSNPVDMLIQKKERLSNDGIIVIGTHDVECENHITEKENWKHIIPNEHLYFFSIESLNKMASMVGLEMFHCHKPIINGFTAYFKKTKTNE